MQYIQKMFIQNCFVIICVCSSINLFLPQGSSRHQIIAHIEMHIGCTYTRIAHPNVECTYPYTRGSKKSGATAWSCMSTATYHDQIIHFRTESNKYRNNSIHLQALLIIVLSYEQQIQVRHKLLESCITMVTFTLFQTF